MIGSAKNFSPGPAQLPVSVMAQIKNNFSTWYCPGVSVCEVSHRSEKFMELSQSIEYHIRSLFSIPSDYKILLLQGGARSQYAMIPMNFMGDSACALYIDSGYWSRYAASEAMRFGRVHVATHDAYSYKKFALPFSYCHYVSNETSSGYQFHTLLARKGIPVVVDMTSDFGTRSIDWNHVDMMYASCQKNLGISGVTVVVIHDELLKKEPLSCAPSVMRYADQVLRHSMLYTPSSFSWYVLDLMLKWIQENGGVAALEQAVLRKSAMLYRIIDAHEIYYNPISCSHRSNMNIVFRVKGGLEEKFLALSKQAGFIGLSGHAVMGGGVRASCYHGVCEEWVQALADFMESFAHEHS